MEIIFWGRFEIRMAATIARCAEKREKTRKNAKTKTKKKNEKIKKN